MIDRRCSWHLMSMRHRHIKFALLASLLVACDLESAGDGSSDGSATDGGETGETGEPQECSFEPNDAFASAQAQPLTLTNSGNTPRFIVPGTCGLLGVDVDGVDYRLGMRYDCAGVPTSPPCYDSCDGHYLTPIIRVDPGASFEWPFSGYVYEAVSIPDICRPDCSQPEISSCGVGHVVEPGAMVGFTFRVASQCEGDPMCECPQGESACALDFDEYSESAEFGTQAERSVSFVHGSPDPVVVDLAQ